jgi:hypothetical protein
VRLGVTGVQAHPDPGRVWHRPVVRGEGGLRAGAAFQRGRGVGQREEQRVTLGEQFGGIGRRERGTDDRTVLGEHGAVLRTEHPSQSRGPLDVGEQERHQAFWQAVRSRHA